MNIETHSGQAPSLSLGESARVMANHLPSAPRLRAKSIRPGMHGSTFGGNALAARVALEFFDILEGLLPQISRVGGYFVAQLNDLAKRFDFIKEVRGYGLMVGVELTIPGKDITLRAIQDGLLMNCTHDTVLRFLPPYIITEQHVDEAIEILTRSLAAV